MIGGLGLSASEPKIFWLGTQQVLMAEQAIAQSKEARAMNEYSRSPSPVRLSRRQLLGGAVAVLGAQWAAPSWGASVAGGPVLLVGTEKTLFRSGDALERSEDAGRTWRALRKPKTPATARIVSMSAGAGKSPLLYVAGPGVGLRKTADGGATWLPADKGLPGTPGAIAAHAQQPSTVYAYLEGKGIFRSEDAGGSWRLMDAGPRGGLAQFAHWDLPGSMQTGWLLAAGPRGVRLAMDCFCGWREAGDIGMAATAVASAPGDPSHVVAATAQGLLESRDAAQSWKPLAGAPRGASSVAFAGGDLIVVADGRMYYRRGGGWETADA